MSGCHDPRIVLDFAEASSVAMVITNRQGRFTFWNGAAERVFGRSREEMLGQPIERIMPVRFRHIHAGGFARVTSGGEVRLAGKMVEVMGLRADGTEFPMALTLSIWNGPDGREFGAHIEDISDRRAREARLEHLAQHDRLTGLPNQTEFKVRIERCLEERGRAAVLVMDLDGFKTVNDTLGHAIGDALLETVAVRMASCVPGGGTLARTGGDEFAILLPDVNDLERVRSLAADLLEAFRASFFLDHHELHVGVSVGMALAPLHASDADELVVRADLALLQAKRMGRGGARLFDADLQATLLARRAFKDELRRAMVERQWTLVYQPQVDLADGAMVGVEALLRWRHPSRGLLSPAAFISALEGHLVAHEVGRWVLNEGCRQLAAWRAAGLEVPRVCINLFAAQFRAGTLVADVEAAVGRNALAFSDLELEVTETVALRSDDLDMAQLRILRERGVGVALDDFGTGYASLTTLKRLPATRLKIDKSFVDDVCEGDQSHAITGALIAMGRNLGLDVIAEGIETAEQWRQLVVLGCPHGQGYLFGRPLEPDLIGTRAVMAA